MRGLPTTGPALRVHLFGQLRLAVDGEPFAFAASRRTLPLLVYLLLRRDSPVPREQLAFTLWPDSEEEDARGQLRVNLHALQRSLPKAELGYWIRSDGAGVQWNAEAPLWLDVAEFDRLAADPRRREELVGLYAGDLAEALYDDWVVSARERYRGLYIAALSDLMSTHRRHLEFDAAIACAQRLLAADPWREDVVRRLIAIRYESGDGAGAVAEYTGFAQRLRAEMNIDPMPETVALRDTVVGGGSASTEDAVTSVRLLPSQRGVLPFVGRAHELDQLKETWSRAARGRGGFVLVSGEAGIGKSRLAMELARHAEDRGARVLAGSTSAPEAMPYQCLVEALRSALPLVASLQLPPVSMAVLAALLPELHQRLGDLQPPPHLDPDREQQRMFETIARSMVALARPRPLLLILEDLHWAQGVTLGALAFLVRRVALCPVLVVATQREEEAPRAHPLRRLRRELQAEGLIDYVAPAPLTLEDVAELIGRLPDARLDGGGADLLRALSERSEGNPLFLTHLIHSGGILGDETPSTLRPMIAATLERLSPSARTVAEIAALVGETFSLDVLSDVSGWGEAAVAAALEELIDRHIVRESAGRTLFAYAFTHQLVQAVARDDVPPDLAVARHRRIARVLEELHPERIDELSATLAMHHERAGDTAVAVERYHTAARRALALGAIGDARDSLSRGVELAVDPVLRISLLRERERLHGLTGDRLAQQHDLDMLAEIAERGNDDALRNEVLLGRVHKAYAVGDYDDQARYIAALRARIDHPERSPLGRAMLQAEAQWLYGIRDFDAACEAGRVALAAHEAAGDRDAQVACLCMLAEAEGNRSREQDAVARLATAQALAQSGGDDQMLARVLATALNIDIFIVTVADHASNLLRALDLRELSVTLGDRRLEARALTFATTALFDLGRYAESLQRNDEVLTICAEIDNRRGMATATLWRSTAALGFGAFEEAHDLLERALAMFETTRDVAGRTQCCMYLSAIAVAEGDLSRARKLAADARRVAREVALADFDAIALGQVADVERAAGKRQRAIQKWEEALTLSANPKRHMIGRDLCGLGTAYAANGQVDAAARCIDRMLAHKTHMEVNVFWPEACHWAAAQVYRLAGRADESRAALSRAHELIAQRLERAPSEQWRASLGALAWHESIVAALRRDEWPPL